MLVDSSGMSWAGLGSLCVLLVWRASLTFSTGYITKDSNSIISLGSSPAQPDLISFLGLDLEQALTPTLRSLLEAKRAEL